MPHWVTLADLADAELLIRVCDLEGHEWSAWSDDEHVHGEIRYCRRCSACQFFTPRKAEAV